MTTANFFTGDSVVALASIRASTRALPILAGDDKETISASRICPLDVGTGMRPRSRHRLIKDSAEEVGALLGPVCTWLAELVIVAPSHNALSAHGNKSVYVLPHSSNNAIIHNGLGDRVLIILMEKIRGKLNQIIIVILIRQCKIMPPGRRAFIPISVEIAAREFLNQETPNNIENIFHIPCAPFPKCSVEDTGPSRAPATG